MVNDKIYQHCESNNIFAFEQKGCIRKAMGCKEQLLIDSVIMKKAQAQKRNLHTCYIDYSKTFDSIPHNWLLKILDIYKISDNVKAMLTYIMKLWRITLKLNNKNIRKGDIRCGIYQGDSLSPMWFCLALNPLSQLLNNTNACFRIKMRDRTGYSHLPYVDDLKLYAESKQQLESLLTVTQQFSDDIKMNFGLDKCATIEIKKGHVVKTEENFMNIPCLEPDDTYKYLGIQQNLGIPHTNLKKEAMEKYKSRPTKLLNTKLNSKNLTRAINCWAIPTLSYSFGILKWSDTDLDELDKTTRRTLTKFRCLHPNSSIQRLYIPRSEGGRGLLNIKSLCKSQERKMREYFLQHTHPNIQTVVEHDQAYTPLNLASPQLEFQIESHSSRINNWEEKILHGKYPLQLAAAHIDKTTSISFLKYGNLHPETEGFMLAIQDRIMRTRNYEKHILKTDTIDVCRKCAKPGETIEHITGACSALADTDYLCRHNQVAKIIHSHLALRCKLIKSSLPYYKYTPDAVLESDQHLLYWDRPIITDKTVDYNRPDILLINKSEKVAWIIDIGIPLTHNIFKTEQEKCRKYINLAIEVKRIWNLKKVSIVPVIISTEGVCTTNLSPNLAKLELQKGLRYPMQKAVILQTCHLVRKFLSI
ncbi:uncharacterized protein LOC115889621 [Sitophilus oryzae]|uniref:Uncharacterized protein LOC115889621 n=1 Tax=Sitophilus oryzae TaxID=7048 RepID=A0A6J2YNG7_SITOR|nr:uncharacterized protein LOC115889621 [Sitophilus oryzae]